MVRGWGLQVIAAPVDAGRLIECMQAETSSHMRTGAQRQFTQVSKFWKNLRMFILMHCGLGQGIGRPSVCVLYHFLRWDAVYFIVVVLACGGGYIEMIPKAQG